MDKNKRPTGDQKRKRVHFDRFEFKR